MSKVNAVKIESVCHLEPEVASAAKRRGAKRTNDVIERVRSVMLVIEAEIVAHDGVYPHNSGVISMAEVARRAGIHFTTFYTEKLQNLGKEVKAWLQIAKEKKEVVNRGASRPIKIRREEWKKVYENLLQCYRDTELELQEIQHQLEKAGRKCDLLELQVSSLRLELSDARSQKVVALRVVKE